MLRPLSAACTLLLFAAPLASAQRSPDAIHVGRDIVVASGQTVGDAVCVLCSIQVEGSTKGDLVAIAGNVYLDGPATGDVIAMGSHVTLTDKSSVRGDIVVFGGQLYRAAGASLAHRAVVLRPIVFLPLILLVAAGIALLAYLLGYLVVRDPVATSTHSW